MRRLMLMSLVLAPVQSGEIAHVLQEFQIGSAS